jgi:flagellar basal-body rod protein FlgB
MGISIDQELGIHRYALQLRSQRSQLIASNLANVDTPQYLARDYDYKTVLGQIEQRLALEHEFGTTHSTTQDMPWQGEVLYRVPLQPSEDGNTVELNTEQSNFNRNAMEFETSLTFLNMKFRGLLKVIEGN